MFEDTLGSLVIAGVTEAIVGMLAASGWENACRNIAIWSGDAMKIDVVVVLQFWMIGTYFLNFSLIFDFPFAIVVF